MSARSLNKVMIIGNLTRDPELRYTPQGTPVCTMGVATNRSWVDSSNKQQEETEYHRAVAWSKLAELCHQLLFKGRKVYLEGRLQTRRWTTQDGAERQTTEIVVDEMIVLDSKRRGESSGSDDTAQAYQNDANDGGGVDMNDNDLGTGDDQAKTDDASGPSDDSRAKAPVADTKVEPVKVAPKTKKVDPKVKKEDTVSSEVGADDIQI